MVSNNYVVHIGYPKSGSTFLQRSIFPKLAINFFYLGQAAYRPVLNILEGKEEFDKEKIYMSLSRGSRNQDKGYEINLLSHEELAGDTHGFVNLCPYQIAKNIKAVFPNAKIIIVIRNQFEYLLSLYTFRVALKGYETKSFSNFLKKESKKGLFERLEYHYLIQYYYKLFGENHVLVVPAEALFQGNKNAMKEMFSFIGVQATQIRIQGSVNKGTRYIPLLVFWRVINFLFMLFLKLLRLLFNNQKGKDDFRKIRFFYYSNKRKINNIINDVFQSENVIKITNYKGYEKLYDKYAKENKQLEQLINKDLRSLGYPVERNR